MYHRVSQLQSWRTFCPAQFSVLSAPKPSDLTDQPLLNWGGCDRALRTRTCAGKLVLQEWSLEWYRRWFKGKQSGETGWCNDLPTESSRSIIRCSFPHIPQQLDIDKKWLTILSYFNNGQQLLPVIAYIIAAINSCFFTSLYILHSLEL